ncbi:hypothetical protein [Actinoplanes regularis]|uniref:WXG100-like domain-containing protein n=1 Tax=Actinoplanes regularis TaxID=52697 RepID=UPI0025570401|nr:hypothetical protein [Actinoplanes regularis]
MTTILDWFASVEEYIPGARSWVGEIILGPIPESSANDVYDLADQWGLLAETLNDAYKDISQAANGILENWSGDESAQRFAEQWFAYLEGLRSTASGTGEMQGAVQKFGLEVELMKFIAAVNLVMLAVSLFMLILAIIPSGGGSIAAAPGLFALCRKALLEAATAAVRKIASISLKVLLKSMVQLFKRLPSALAKGAPRVLAAGKGAVPKVLAAGKNATSRALADAGKKLSRDALAKAARTGLTNLAPRQLAARGISKAVAQKLAAKELRKLATRELTGTLNKGVRRTLQRELSKEIREQLLKNWAKKKVGQEAAESAATRVATTELEKIAARRAAEAGLGREFVSYVGTRTAFGAMFMGGTDVLGQMFQEMSGNRTEMDWGHVGTSTLQGAAFGAGMFGGPIGHAVGGALAGGGTALGTEVYAVATGQSDSINWSNVGHGAVQGAAAGVIFGGQTHLESSHIGGGHLRIGEDVQVLPGAREGDFTVVSARSTHNESLVLTSDGQFSWSTDYNGGSSGHSEGFRSTDTGIQAQHMAPAAASTAAAPGRTEAPAGRSDSPVRAETGARQTTSTGSGATSVAGQERVGVGGDGPPPDGGPPTAARPEQTATGDHTSAADRGADDVPADRGVGDRPAAAGSGVHDSGIRDSGPTDRVIDGASGDRSISDGTASDRPAGEHSAGDRAGADQQSGERSGTDRPAVDRSATDSFATDRPGVDRPVSDRTGPDQPLTDRVDGDRVATDRVGGDRAAADRVGGDRAAADRVGGDRAATERPAGERTAPDRAASDRTPSGRVASERASSERVASERASSERAVSERASSERAVSERASSERAVSERASSERAVSERASSERAASERASSERAVSERRGTEHRRDEVAPPARHGEEMPWRADVDGVRRGEEPPAIREERSAAEHSVREGEQAHPGRDGEGGGRPHDETPPDGPPPHDETPPHDPSAVGPGEKAMAAAGHETGVDPTPESIRQGTVRFREHPDFPRIAEEMRELGVEIYEEDAGWPETEYRHVYDAKGKVFWRLEKRMRVIPDMRFLDFEHEVGHVHQMESRTRFPNGPEWGTNAVRDTGDGTFPSAKAVPNIIGNRMFIVEYHVRLEEIIRLDRNGADPAIVAKHIEGLGEYAREYKQHVETRSQSKNAKFAADHFPDIPALREQVDAIAEALPERAAAESPAVRETPAAREAPTVRETPAAQEAPAARESPTVRETPAAQERQAGPETPRGTDHDSESGSPMAKRGDTGRSHVPGEHDPFRLISVDGPPMDRPVAAPHEVVHTLNGEMTDLVNGRQPSEPGVPHHGTWDSDTQVMRVRFGDGLEVDVKIQVNESVPPGRAVVVRPPMEALDGGGWRQTQPAGVVLSTHVPEDVAARPSHVRETLNDAWRILHSEVGDQLRPPAEGPAGRAAHEGVPASPHDSATARDSATAHDGATARDDATGRDGVTARDGASSHDGGAAPHDDPPPGEPMRAEEPPQSLRILEIMRGEDVPELPAEVVNRHPATRAEPPPAEGLNRDQVSAQLRSRTGPEQFGRWSTEHLAEQNEHGGWQPKSPTEISRTVDRLAEQALDQVTPRHEEPPTRTPQSHEQARQEQARQEQARQEQARQEQARQEQARQEQARQEQARQEQARQEQARQEQARQEQARQEQARQERVREERARQEVAARERAEAEQRAQREQELHDQRRLEEEQAEGRRRLEELNRERQRHEDELFEQQRRDDELREQQRRDDEARDQRRWEEEARARAEAERAAHEQPGDGPGGRGQDGESPRRPGEPRPSLRELFAPDENSLPESVRRAEAAFRHEMAGRDFAGLEVRVREVVAFSEGQFEVRMDIHRPGQSQPVGVVHRLFSRNPDGTVEVHHEKLKLDRWWQGRGFSRAFNNHMEGWYVESGVDRITLRAAMDIGGYVWARDGFNWSRMFGERFPSEVFARLRTEINRLNQDLGQMTEALSRGDVEAADRIAGKYGYRDSAEGLSRMTQESRDAEALHRRHARTRFGHADYPTPYELSQVGRAGQEGAEGTWIGKRAMLGSDWRGERAPRWHEEAPLRVEPETPSPGLGGHPNEAPDLHREAHEPYRPAEDRLYRPADEQPYTEADRRLQQDRIDRALNPDRYAEPDAADANPNAHDTPEHSHDHGTPPRTNEDVLLNGSEVPFTHDAVAHVADLMGLDLSGVDVHLISDLAEARMYDREGVSAVTPPEHGGRQVRLGPAAFADAETLAATVAHEHTHVRQLREGRVTGPHMLRELEAEAYASESAAVQRFRQGFEGWESAGEGAVLDRGDHRPGEPGRPAGLGEGARWGDHDRGDPAGRGDRGVGEGSRGGVRDSAEPADGLGHARGGAHEPDPGLRRPDPGDLNRPIGGRRPGEPPFGFDRFYSDGGWPAEARRFETAVGVHFFNDPHTLGTMREAVSRLREVLTDLATIGETEPVRKAEIAREVEQAFFRDDPRAVESAGQVGRDVPLDTLLREGNVRELATAFYNAAYSNRSSPHRLSMALISAFDHGRLREALAAGLDLRELRGVHHQVEMSTVRRVVGSLEDRLPPEVERRFARDPMTTGNALRPTQRGYRNLLEVVSSQWKRGDAPERLLPDRANTLGHYERIGAPLGKFEREFLERMGGERLEADSKLAWREGEVVHDIEKLDNTRWARGVKRDGHTIQDGVSATTTRMLTAAQLIGFHGPRAESFLHGLMGWMLPSRDHSLFEILRGASMAEVEPVAVHSRSERLTAADLHRSLPGVDLHTIRTAIARDGLVPHEVLYLDHAQDTSIRGFTETHHKVPEIADRIWSQLRSGRVEEGSPLREWMERNGIDPDRPEEVRAFGERLTKPHIMALTVYTRHSHYLINNVITAEMLNPTPAETPVRIVHDRKINALVDNYLNNKVDGAKQLPLPLALRPIVHVGDGHLDSTSAYRPSAERYIASTRAMRDAQAEAARLLAAGDQAGAERAAEAADRAEAQAGRAHREIRQELRKVAPRLFEEMRWHADMSFDALQQLPTVGSREEPVIAYRGDWTTRYYSPIYGSKAFPDGRALSVLSMSPLSDVAVRFMSENPAGDNRVIAVYKLTGVAARDISVFSSFPEDQEVVLPPGSKTRQVYDPALVEATLEKLPEEWRGRCEIIVLEERGGDG